MQSNSLLAKKYVSYDLGGHSINQRRVNKGSPLNNFKILELKKKIEVTLTGETQQSTTDSPKEMKRSLAKIPFVDTRGLTFSSGIKNSEDFTG
mmetsp:Transcript_30919/g.47295  ORF Transcript_30919/g.47295 Transcript_30919/m.47295 type:complete len:93 (-) Transcript_30919:383-661(-)